ncbi:MAG: trans-acting enoyl reductase family protein [Paracoccaceae bacterium]
MAEFDVIIYGASGYTGRLVAQHFHNTYPDRSFAMAGRSLNKLADVRAEIGLPDSVALIAADAADPASLQTMVARTKVVITTVGPYQLYGEPLVAACATSGTDYVDLSGEPNFMWQMIETYDDVAKASGARIVHSCGFDSIPFEMGVFFLQSQAQARFGAPIRDVKARVRSLVGSFSGGTLASGQATMKAAMGDPITAQRLQSPFALTPGFEGAAQPTGHKPYEDTDMGSWVAPFFMATINTKNVHRSNFLMGHPYGTDFTYEEMIATGPGDKGQATATALSQSNPLQGSDLKPGEGPTAKERETGSYNVMFAGTAVDGTRFVAGVTGDRDAGYGSTSKMITQAAMCLIDDVPDAPGGVLTPGPVMGMALIERLRKTAGLTFEIEG